MDAREKERIDLIENAVRECINGVLTLYVKPPSQVVGELEAILRNLRYWLTAIDEDLKKD